MFPFSLLGGNRVTSFLLKAVVLDLDSGSLRFLPASWPGCTSGSAKEWGERGFSLHLHPEHLIQEKMPSYFSDITLGCWCLEKDNEFRNGEEQGVRSAVMSPPTR